MTYLVLDLDKTAIVTEEDLKHIDSAHELSQAFEGSLTFNKNTSNKTFRIINPKELASLIATAYSPPYDGIMVLTAGCWDKSILQTLAANMVFSEDPIKNEAIREKLKHAHFHSVATDYKYFYPDATVMDRKNLRSLKKIPKSVRLGKIIEDNLELFAKKTWVVVDDDSGHISSFYKCKKLVCAIWATTMGRSKSFYGEAKKALALMHDTEQKLYGVTFVQSIYNYFQPKKEPFESKENSSTSKAKSQPLIISSFQ